MRKLLNMLIYWIDCVIPKKENQFSFSSFPDISDNSYVMFKYLFKSMPGINVVWLLTDTTKTNSYYGQIQEDMLLEDEEMKRITFIKKNSFHGLVSYMMSKYVFYTHGLYPQLKYTKSHILINLWHGMPLKKIGFLLDENNKNMPKANFIVSTSPFFQQIMMKVFKQEKNEILVSGQPRNDLLFETNGSLKKFNINKKQYKKVFLWTPTFRQTITDISLIDGNSFIGLPIVSNDYEALNSHLEKLNSYMIIKLHPMDILNNDNFDSYTNLLFLRNVDMEKESCQLNTLLGEVDVLITDFSSIYIDYLLLNRPIGFAMDDLETYKSSRGFVVDNPEEYMPGEFISTKESFMIFLENCTKDIDMYKSRREEINDLFNTNKRNFSKILWEQIIERT